MLTDENIELLIFRYKEGLLDDNEREQIEKYLAENPDWRELADLYDPDLCVPAYSDIVFPDKEKLKKNTEKRKWLWLSISAAACAALFVGFAIRFIFGDEMYDNTFLAKSGQNEIKDKSGIIPLDNKSDSTVVQNVAPEDEKRVISRDKKSLMTEPGIQVESSKSDDVIDATDGIIDFHNNVTDRLIAYSDDNEIQQPVEQTPQQFVGVDQLIFAKPDTILTDQLITYLDDNNDPSQSKLAGRTAFECAVEDWINTIRLKSTEIQIALINKL